MDRRGVVGREQAPDVGAGRFRARLRRDQRDRAVPLSGDRALRPRRGRGLRWNDAAIAIDWPIAEPSLSDKDAKAPFLADIPEARLPVYSA
jgi:hypothetical protein